jgi:hypothetical protein
MTHCRTVINSQAIDTERIITGFHFRGSHRGFDRGNLELEIKTQVRMRSYKRLHVLFGNRCIRCPTIMLKEANNRAVPRNHDIQHLRFVALENMCKACVWLPAWNASPGPSIDPIFLLESKAHYILKFSAPGIVGSQNRCSRPFHVRYQSNNRGVRVEGSCDSDAVACKSTKNADDLAS